MDLEFDAVRKRHERKQFIRKWALRVLGLSSLLSHFGSALA
jgi:hypothetical protein